MTPKERRKPKSLMTAEKRIAKGCGMPVERVNKLLKQFNMSKKMMKKMGKKTRHGKPSFGQMPGNFRGF